jgi:hypothetical protein
VKNQSTTKIELFNAALEIRDGVERERYLAEVCAGDSELRARIEALIEAHTRGAATFEALVPGFFRGNRSSELLAGQRIASYSSLEKLGEGVVLAAQGRGLRLLPFDSVGDGPLSNPVRAL